MINTFCEVVKFDKIQYVDERVTSYGIKITVYDGNSVPIYSNKYELGFCIDKIIDFCNSLNAEDFEFSQLEYLFDDFFA